MIEQLVLRRSFYHLERLKKKVYDTKKYLTAQNPETMKDSGGQAHRRRHFFPESSTKEIGLDSSRQECTLSRQGEVHRKAPEKNHKCKRKRREISPGREVPQHMDPEGIKLSFNGYE